MSECYWQDGQWHTPEQPQPPLEPEKMLNVETMLQDLMDGETDVNKAKKIEEIAAELSMRLFKNEQDEQNQAA